MTHLLHLLILLLVLSASNDALAWKLCPQAQMVKHWQSGALTDMWFTYSYTNPTYDTFPSPDWNGPTDKKNILSLEMLDVINSSEEEWYFAFDTGLGEKWANWWIHVYPLKESSWCQNKSGAELYVCENAAYTNMNIADCFPNTPGVVCVPHYLVLHASGPFLSDSNQCEWHQQNLYMYLDNGTPLAGKYIAGQQVAFYSNFILWDWDNWNFKGNTAKRLWVRFKEGDEEPQEDDPILDGEVHKDKLTTLKSGHATAIINTYTNLTDDGDGIPTGVEIKKFGTNPNKADSDGDGLTDADELGFVPCVGSWQSLDYGTDPNKADTDGDGLSDFDEIDQCLKKMCENPSIKSFCKDTLVTNPAKPDTDGDGWSDGDEVASGSNPNDPNSPGIPANGDADGDGISNADELKKYKTNPKSKDTDSDGLEDGQEINITKSDPTKTDSDSDGLSDGEEVKTYKTSPVATDTDKDGLSDGDEVKKYDSDPLEEDSDGDGILDGVEVASGTSPVLNEAAVLSPVLAILLDDEEIKGSPPIITGVPLIPVLKVPKDSIKTVDQNTIIKSEIGLASVKMECGNNTPIKGTPLFVPAFNNDIYSFKIQVGPVTEAVLCQISATDIAGQTTSVPFQIIPDL